MSDSIGLYDARAAELVTRYEAVDPAKLNHWLLDLIPQTPGTVLDVGAGSGRDAAWFALKGKRQGEGDGKERTQRNSGLRVVTIRHGETGKALEESREK